MTCVLTRLSQGPGCPFSKSEKTFLHGSGGIKPFWVSVKRSRTDIPLFMVVINFLNGPFKNGKKKKKKESFPKQSVIKCLQSFREEQGIFEL